MRVAVDGRELTGKPTGVGRYLRELLTEWGKSANARRHEWVVYAPEMPDVPPTLARHVRVLPGSGGTAWEQWTLSRALAADRPDVLFAPGYTAPLTAPCPVAVAIHDVSFAAHPEWFHGTEPWPCSSPEATKLLKHFEAACFPLECKITGTKIGIGVATGADIDCRITWSQKLNVTDM